MTDEYFDKEIKEEDRAGTHIVGELFFGGELLAFTEQIGQEYYIVDKNSDYWCYGELLGCYGYSVGCGRELRHFRIRLEKENGQVASGIKEFSGDSVKLYTYMLKNEATQKNLN